MDFDNSRDEFVSTYGGRRPMRLNITKGQAMEVSSVWCQEEIQSLRQTSAGGHGPPQEYMTDDYHGDFLLSVHEAMCTPYCLSSDHLRKEAIETSNCSCIELSTGEDAISYTKEGDFCLENSGRFLCEDINLNVCSECDLDDFMCPRRKYDAIQVPLKGYGSDCNGGTILSHSRTLAALACILCMKMFWR
jgi:hypothetical protein